MKLHAQNPPHIRSRESHQTITVDVIIALLPLYAMATYFYGKRAIVLGLFSAAITTVLDMLFVAFRHRVPNIRDHSALVTGLIIPLLMPASSRFDVVAIAAVFAMAIAKHPFGGVGHNIFNPAVAGIAFVSVCFPRSMFSYPVPFDVLPINITERIRLVAAPARSLALGGVPALAPLDMLLGNFPGPMGATNILVLITCLLFLAVRRSVSISLTASYIVGFSFVAAFWPRAMLTPELSVFYELTSGIALITAVFLINDPVTSPKRLESKVIYGLLTGIFCMVLRKIGRYEESILFALLIMNAAVWIIDMLGERIAHSIRRIKIESQKSKEIPSDIEEDDGSDQE